MMGEPAVEDEKWCLSPFYSNLELTVLSADERRAKQVQARQLPLEAGVRG
jgi:hypothetical protein